MDIIEKNTNTRELFSVHIIEDGTYLAIRDSSPMFCFHGSSIEEVVNKANSAFDFMKSIK